MEERIKEILAEELGAELSDVTLEANLKEDLDADSIDMMQVVGVLEEEFDTDVETEELASIVTVGDIIEYIKKKTA